MRGLPPPLLLPCPPHGPVLWADPAGVRNSDANVGWGDTQLHHRDTGAALRAHRSDTERTRDRSTTTPCSCSRPPGSRCFLQQPPKCTNRASGDDRSLWKAACGTACRSVSRLPRGRRSICLAQPAANAQLPRTSGGFSDGSHRGSPIDEPQSDGFRQSPHAPSEAETWCAPNGRDPSLSVSAEVSAKTTLWQRPPSWQAFRRRRNHRLGDTEFTEPSATSGSQCGRAKK